MSFQSTGEQRHSRGESFQTPGLVSQEQAFYFYKGIGQPLNVSSRSMSEFADIVQDIDPTSVQFHVERGDFERWFRLLGEQALANQISGLRGKDISPQELRSEIGLTVGLRVKEISQKQSQGRPDRQS
jgi:Family of unknown function (DUF5752)